ncbi:hypothetical protein [Kaistia algarum]|uniref:hypothetical protein n=1 Tax=Kaistia algarum TaxID=2083279 RepID=UPI00225BC01C|nr:hypothetical protein [Kaistia algarum]MCX5512135.1 hypothetical protein [Kaistia algarum]
MPRTAIVMLLSAAVAGCGMTAIGPSRSLQRAVDTELQVGSSAKEIERFLSRNVGYWSWDDAQDRYEGIIRLESSESVSIQIDVDKHRRFVRAHISTGCSCL